MRGVLVIDDDALVHDTGLWFYGNTDGKAFYDDADKVLPNNVDRFGFDNTDSDAADDATDDAGENSDAATDGDTDGALALGDDVENGSGSSAGSKPSSTPSWARRSRKP